MDIRNMLHNLESTPGQQFWLSPSGFLPVEDIVTASELKSYQVSELRLSVLRDLEETYPGTYYIMASYCGIYYIIRKVPQSKKEKAKAGDGSFKRNQPFRASDFVDSYIAPNSYKKPCKHFVMKTGYTIMGISALLKHYPHIKVHQVQELYTKFGYGKLNPYEKKVIKENSITDLSRAKELIKKNNIRLDPDTDMFIIKGESWSDSEVATALGVDQGIANIIIDEVSK